MPKVLLLFSIITLILIAGCASSSNNEIHPDSFPDLVELQQPGPHSKHQPSKVYIDSVETASLNQQPVLIIHGTFPDGCTNLGNISHAVKNDTLHIDLKAWRDPQKMCTQVLTPFTYIYQNITEEELDSHSGATVNGSTYTF